MEWISEIVWACLLLLCLAWELVGVFYEKRFRIEPLTRIYRDRLMRHGRLGIVFRLAFLAFWGWLALHWLVPLDW